MSATSLQVNHKAALGALDSFDDISSFCLSILLHRARSAHNHRDAERSQIAELTTAPLEGLTDCQISFQLKFGRAR
jgi:hypothetical protein